MAPEPADAQACLNCEAPLSGPYCSACGQKDLPAKLGLGELLGEVVGEALELDGRVPRTLVPFLFRPGFLSREYAAGRRVRYSSPFRLFLFTTFLWLLAAFISDLGEDPGDIEVQAVVLDIEDAEIEDTPEWISAPAQDFTSKPVAEQSKEILDNARESLPTASLLALPLFAALMKLLFIRRDRYYVEHLVFALHLHAFAFFTLAVATLIAPGSGLLPSFALIGLYALVALHNAYDARWWTSALRLFVLVFVHTVVLVTVAAIVTGVSVLL